MTPPACRSLNENGIPLDLITVGRRVRIHDGSDREVTATVMRMDRPTFGVIRLDEGGRFLFSAHNVVAVIGYTPPEHRAAWERTDGEWAALNRLGAVS